MAEYIYCIPHRATMTRKTCKKRKKEFDTNKGSTAFSMTANPKIYGCDQCPGPKAVKELKLKLKRRRTRYRI